jgi:hypothetical protein
VNGVPGSYDAIPAEIRETDFLSLATTLGRDYPGEWVALEFRGHRIGIETVLDEHLRCRRTANLTAGGYLLDENVDDR